MEQDPLDCTRKDISSFSDVTHMLMEVSEVRRFCRRTSRGAGRHVSLKVTARIDISSRTTSNDDDIADESKIDPTRAVVSQSFPAAEFDT